MAQERCTGTLHGNAAQERGKINLLSIQEGSEARFLPALIQLERQNGTLKPFAACNPATAKGLSASTLIIATGSASWWRHV